MQNREYQQRAIKYLCSIKRGILKAPAGAGKTHIAASALDRCLRNRKERASIEIMVNTREQVEQMETACARFDIASKCNLRIYCAAGAPIGTNPDLLIIDECHRSSSSTWSAKIASCDGGRWGLSATPYDDKDADQIATIKRLFAERMHVIERGQLVDNGHLSKARVIWRNVDCDGIAAKIESLSGELIEKRRKKMPYLFKTDDDGNPTPKMREQINQCRWQAAQQIGVWENDARDYLIISEANQRVADGRHVIVLIGNKDHGERLRQAINGSLLVHAGIGAKARRYAIDQFRTGSLRCMVGSSAIEEGFDAPIADCLILASAGKSQRKAIQSTGRVLRPFEGKESGIIVDFTDNFHPMLARQAGKRRSIYRGLNYGQI